MNLTRMVGWLLLASGLIAIVVSIIFVSSILAFVGLGFTFWGPLLLYMSTEKLVKQILLDSTIIPSLANLDQILTELEYKGKGIYLPPKYFKDFEKCKIFISKNKNTRLPTPEEIQKREDKVFLRNPEGALISPPGLSLSKLFEKTLGTNFTKVDLKYLQQNLKKLLIEDLEIAENLEMQTKHGEVNIEMAESVFTTRKYEAIRVRITNPVYKDVCTEARKLPRMCSAIGCPICSAIACALVKATGNPVLIENAGLSEDGKTIEADFQLLETIEPKERIEELLEEAIEIYSSRSFLRARAVNLASILLTSFGSTILAGVGWLIGYDMTVWGKDINLILFGSRTGEAMSLGIGIKAIHYLVIGLALLLSGLLTFLQRRSKV